MVRTNSPAGWQSVIDWVSEQGAERRIGIEGAWSYGRGLAQRLIEVGELVYEVNTRWTALGRRYARGRDKNDRFYARAVAR